MVRTVVDEQPGYQEGALLLAATALIKKGQTQEQIVASKPTADYDAKVPQPGTTGERFIGQLYAELGGK